VPSSKENQVLGPLPRLYSILVSVVAVAVFVFLGAWAAVILPVRTVVLLGAGIGAGLGTVAAFLVLHDFHLDRAASADRPPGRRGRR
jgi:hypothetical protein